MKTNKPKFKVGDRICDKDGISDELWQGNIVAVIGNSYKIEWSTGGIDQWEIFHIDKMCALRTNIEDIWQKVLNE